MLESNKVAVPGVSGKYRICERVQPKRHMEQKYNTLIKGIEERQEDYCVQLQNSFGSLVAVESRFLYVYGTILLILE